MKHGSKSGESLAAEAGVPADVVARETIPVSEAAAAAPTLGTLAADSEQLVAAGAQLATICEPLRLMTGYSEPRYEQKFVSAGDLETLNAILLGMNAERFSVHSFQVHVNGQITALMSRIADDVTIDDTTPNDQAQEAAARTAA